MQQQGWRGLSNGELLRQAELDRFDVLLTADQSLSYQQNLTTSALVVIVLVARSTKL